MLFHVALIFALAMVWAQQALADDPLTWDGSCWSDMNCQLEWTPVNAGPVDDCPYFHSGITGLKACGGCPAQTCTTTTKGQCYGGPFKCIVKP
ncbi:unnamed protein product [Jaminaea pallidilutea]